MKLSSQIQLPSRDMQATYFINRAVMIARPLSTNWQMISANEAQRCSEIRLFSEVTVAVRKIIYVNLRRIDRWRLIPVA
jgi:hypothetical protein